MESIITHSTTGERVCVCIGCSKVPAQSSSFRILLFLTKLTAHFASAMLLSFGYPFCSHFAKQIWSRPTTGTAIIIIIVNYKIKYYLALPKGT